MLYPALQDIHAPAPSSPFYPFARNVGRPHAPLAVTSEAKLSGEPVNPEPEVAD